MHPADMVFYWAKADPERIAIAQLDMAISYRGLAEAIHAAEIRIKALNFRPGMPVAVAINDPARRIAVVFALLRAKVPAALVSAGFIPNLGDHEISIVITDDVRHVLVGGRNIRFDDNWIRHDGRTSLVWDSQPSPAIETHLIFFTSGTTGTPKKIVTPGYALMDRVGLLTVTGESRESRILILPGLDSAFGFTRAAVRLHAGMTSCFATSYETQLRAIEAFNVDTIIGSPQQVLGLVEHLQNGAKHRLSSVKTVRIGGGFTSSDLVRRVQGRLCRNVTTEYGSTETGLIALAPYDSILHIPSAVGLPAPGVRIEIVDETNNPVPPGAEGLVRARTSQFIKSLAANNPDRASQVDSIWWYPGDVGSLTAEGVLCIGGRVDDVINCGGAKISAIALDEIARKHPGVSDAGICGVRSRTGGDEVWVGVVAREAIDVAALTRSLDESQGFRIGVREVLVLDEIPRNQMGKLQRHKLKEVMLGMKARAGA